MNHRFLRISTGIVAFGIALFFAIPMLAFLTCEKEQTIQVAPIGLVADERCERHRWDSLSENPICYSLQESLIEAAGKGDTEIVLESLARGANADGTYYQSFSALTASAMKGHLEVARILIANGADVNAVEKWDTSTLQTAVVHRQSAVAGLLLANGADVCHAAHWDDLSTPTALDIAISNRDTETIRLLIAYGATLCPSQYF